MTSPGETIGILHSILRYYAVPFRLRRLTRFYAQFICPGDLCFDVGAHVGSRLRVWSRLGAFSLAVEPQPGCLRFLHRWYGRHPNIILVECALGSTEGEQTLLVSRRTPTLATLSTQWIEAVRQAPSFAGVRWDASIRVKVRTLDSLIRQYGEPAFCKIDVEGYELEVLKGLSRPLPCLSFEYIPAATWLSTGCIQRLEVLGVYEFNYTVGEAAYLSLEKWTSGERMAAWLETLKPDDPSGDIYARRIPAR